MIDKMPGMRLHGIAEALKTQEHDATPANSAFWSAWGYSSISNGPGEKIKLWHDG
jgi:hypothetical protein